MEIIRAVFIRPHTTQPPVKLQGVTLTSENGGDFWLETAALFEAMAAIASIRGHPTYAAFKNSRVIKNEATARKPEKRPFFRITGSFFRMPSAEAI